MKHVRRVKQASNAEANEGGFAVIMTALLLIPLMAFTGFAVDIGSWYARGSTLQKAADSAALAGVIWMPDLAKARSVALEVAAKNGMVDGVNDVSVTVTQTLLTNQLEVKIVDRTVDMYFASLFLDKVDISRKAVAEYVTEVPLGSPKNYFGTGKMISGTERENISAAINGFCTPREQGDHRSVRFEGNWATPGYTADMICPTPIGPGPNSGTYAGNTSSALNPYFLPGYSYDYYVDVPPGAGTTALMLFDPAYHGNGSTQQGYDRTNSTTRITTTFAVFAPDNTPFDDTDNPAYNCGSGTGGAAGRKTFATNATDFTHTLSTTGLTSASWERFCFLSAGSTPLRYILRVDTLDGQLNSMGSNNYALLADPAGSVLICDTRTSSSCPAVVAKEWMSVDADETFGTGTCSSSNPTTTRAANFFLAEIGNEHQGKSMRIELFDPGEGSSYIQVLNPLGNPVNFAWRDKENPSVGGTANSINVSGTITPPAGRASSSRYSDRFLQISVDLPTDFSVYGSARWWKVRYVATVPNGCSVSDRSSWSVIILGDPVRLIE